MHEPALLDNLRHRFERDHVYTYTGKICIAVNPFNWQLAGELYSESLLVKYRGTEQDDMPPHVYGIAEQAYQKILDADHNQSILVSGESGAGKTESVKIMMQYLAVVSKSSGSQNKVAAQVLASNPLLEAFGNARTMRNNNSSRFGKFIEIQFSSRQYKMAGARIHIYLLEKSRVVQQSTGERNYHVFYQLLAGLSAEERAKVHLDAEIETFHLLNQSGCVAIEGVDDAEELGQTRTAMVAIGMDESQSSSVVSTLAAVLLLAQLAFEQDEDEKSAVAADSAEMLTHIAGLLGPEQAEDLSAALCTRRLITRDDEITVPLTLEQARDSRDALGKSIYGRLFSWLVERCNEKLVDDDATAAFIGILDIFGFETFKINSFEQLCINYANERLQQQFNWDVFKSEQAEYEAEGIEWKYIEFIDNQACLDLIDSKKQMGILHLLDEECAIQKGSDETLAQKLRDRFGAKTKHDYFEAPKREKECFVVKHYAGDVTYLCTGFREKNKDALHPDIAGVMQQSNVALVAALFPAAEAAVAATPGGKGGGGKKKGGKNTDRMTVASQFMSQLASLMKTINETDVHYVRCIKPNTMNKPKIFQLSHSALQLRCAGVLEAVRISRMAYPNRMPHAAYVRRYHLLATPKWNSANPSAVLAARKSAGTPEVLAFCESLLRDVVDDSTRYQLGKTKVFFRAFLLEALEQRRSAALSVSAVVVQKHLRALMAQQRFRRMLHAAVLMQKVQRFLAARRAYHKQRAASIQLQAAARGAQTRKLTKRLRAAVRLASAARAKAARTKVTAMRRHARSTTIQKHARRRAKQQRFCKMRTSALRLQSYVRMAQQRRAYRRELKEKKEEAKLSNQLEKLQARLQAEMEARQQAELEQVKLRADIASGAVAPPAAPAVPPAFAAEGAAAAAGAAAGVADAADAGEIGSRLGKAAGKFFSGFMNANSVDETAQMLQAVTKDREKLSKRLQEETDARKRLEVERRELESKLTTAGVSTSVNSRKTKDVHASLARKTEELKELKRMFQEQANEVSHLQSNALAKDKKLGEMDKKLSQFDDQFYALEARNVRDRTKFEEMSKAKNKAEEERSIYRLMLEQCYEVRGQRRAAPQLPARMLARVLTESAV